MKKIVFACLVAGIMLLSSCGTGLYVAAPVPPVGTVVVATPARPVIVYETYPTRYYRPVYHRPVYQRPTPPPPAPKRDNHHRRR